MTTESTTALGEWNYGHRFMDLIDCHTHTAYSGHGEGSVAQVVSAADARNVKVLAFTEHLRMPDGVDPQNECSLSKESNLRYRAEVKEAASEADFEIILGGEADWLDNPDFIENEAKGLDYLLGSVHMIDGFEFDHPDYLEGWKKWGNDAVWNRYFEIWRDALRSGLFDCMAHPDLPKKFGYLPSFDLSDLYLSLADEAKRADVGIEVNTSGARKPVGEFYPSPLMLSVFCDAGVPCTVGSDAHRPSEVACDIEEAYGYMKEAGYDEVCVPTGSHERRFLAL